MAYNNELPSYESLLEFQAVYLRAVALSWRNDKFHTEFVANPFAALAKWLNYNCPRNLDLVVREPKAEGCGWDAGNSRWILPPNKITIGLPEPPKVQDQGIALAAYNDSGPTYLFTCC